VAIGPKCWITVLGRRHLVAVFTVKPPPAPPSTLVTVTAGKAPDEFHFTLSRQSVPEGVVTFDVSNSGALPHDFEVCRTPGDGLALGCFGSGTPTLVGAGGGSPRFARLTVRFRSPGTYEYLSTIPGQAAAGMHGLITVTAS
jgi:hypothetical protein